MTGAEDDPLARARMLASTDDARVLYDHWASTYDDDVFDRMGVTGSRRVAELFAEHVPDRETPVIDIGCGTGVVGRHLAHAGFRDLTGIDLSPGMLAVAHRHGIYGELIEADLDAPPELDRRFGGSVSAGTFTTGHVTAAAIPGVLALHRPGATISWSVAPTLWPTCATALTDARVDIMFSRDEPIRPGTDDRSQMIVGVLPG